MRKQPEAAKTYAQEALEAARAMRRQSEIAIAEAMLARIQADGSTKAAEERIGRLCREVADGDSFNARARAIVDEAVAFGLVDAPTAPLPSARDGKRKSRR